jgi:hypothetical protein
MREPKTPVEKVWEQHLVHRVEGERPTFAAPVGAYCVEARYSTGSSHQYHPGRHLASALSPL